MIEYKAIKLRQASPEKGVNEKLNDLAKEGWEVKWFDGGWIILYRWVGVDTDTDRVKPEGDPTRKELTLPITAKEMRNLENKYYGG